MPFTRRQIVKSAAASALMLPVFASLPLSAYAAPIDGFFEELPLPEMQKGKDDAKVTLTEYASMTCPHCKSFHENILPELQKKYIETGKIKYQLREFAFDPLAAAAFMLARCAPNGNYFPMVDVLFAQQETWSRSDNPVQALLKISKVAGFTEESFKKCLTDQELLDNINKVKARGQKEFGVDATPTLFINGEKFSGETTVDEISAAIDKLL